METSIKTIACIIGLCIVGVLTHKVVNHKIDQYANQIDMVVGPTTKEIQRNLDCLALNIYREAGHEIFQGKVAVAQVTINRTEDGRFPKDICGVVYQKNIFTGRIVCQFSWFCDQAVKLRPKNEKAYQESMEVAKKVYLEDFRLDSVRDALYYHANYVNPNWGYQKIATIGNHIFYTDKKR